MEDRVRFPDGLLMNIKYVKGDATYPQVTEGKAGIVCHICNDIGAWGAGFVLALHKRWNKPRQHYMQHSKFLRQGNYHLVKVEENIWVANLIAQSGIGYVDDLPPIRYLALEESLRKMVKRLDREQLDYELHMPHMGCGLAGGNWGSVFTVLKKVFSDRDIDITVYSLL